MSLLCRVLLKKTNVYLPNKNLLCSVPTASISRKNCTNSKGYSKRHRFILPGALKASFSLEAAVVLPVMVCAVVFVLIFFRILSVQWGVTVGSQDVARSVAVYGDGGSQLQEGGILGKTAIMATAHGKVMEKQVPVKFVTLGQAGIDFSASTIDEKDVSVESRYLIQLPVGLFGPMVFNLNHNSTAKRWVGYDPHEDDAGDDEYVYVTKTGVAYHRDIGCSYLDPSISAVATSEVSTRRNNSGAKYYPCEICGSASVGISYVTDYGTVYHSRVTCSGLVRYILSRKLQEAIEEGYHACGKCG